ncbi:MAG: hypothetical protein ACRDTH_09780 [Pseudonocardiaceae bacterium]
MSRGHKPATARVISVTCAEDGKEHMVTDEQMVVGRAARSGRYMGLCGHLVRAAAMVCPPGRSCPGCAVAAGARMASGGSEKRHWRPGRRRRA